MVNKFYKCTQILGPVSYTDFKTSFLLLALNVWNILYTKHESKTYFILFYRQTYWSLDIHILMISLMGSYLRCPFLGGTNIPSNQCSIVMLRNDLKLVETPRKADMSITGRVNGVLTPGCTGWALRPRTSRDAFDVLNVRLCDAYWVVVRIPFGLRSKEEYYRGGAGGMHLLAGSWSGCPDILTSNLDSQTSARCWNYELSGITQVSQAGNPADWWECIP